MKQEFEIKISPDGSIETIYQEGLEEFAQEMGADVARVCRASNVEWEDGITVKGWTVRAAHDPTMALRKSHTIDSETTASRTGLVVYYQSREAAIEQELKHFWQLLEKEGPSNG